MEWFISLDTFLKTYWIIAGITSLIFIIQTIMTFIGMDASDGLDADFDGDMHVEGPFQLFSIRNLVNFFLGFGWGGICFYNTFSSKVWVSVFAFLTGVIFVVLFFFIIKQFLKLGKDNTFQIKDTIGKTADVYLAIPEAKSGKGKIQISVKGAFHEIDAMTEGERIPTGGKVQVIKTIDNQSVLVVKL
jgi:membrane protein implicated in regulation of membrane protease activity